MSKETKTKVIKALENNQFDWRTLDGITAEVRESKAQVVEAIELLSREGVIVRASSNATTGEPLFTTRKHYKQRTPMSLRLLSALKNRGG